VALISYSTILFSLGLGWIFWAEVPDALSLLGGVLIIGGAVVAFAPTESRGPADGAAGS
jgi:drug/metabolite transporter (DMT)-like permease